MLTPKELYESYSITPCSTYYIGETPFSIENGRGTPFDFKKIMKFLKHVKYPCYNSMEQGVSIHAEINGTGNKKLALTYKFLEELDREAYLEGQPRIDSGTAYSIRNSVDLARACYFKTTNKTGDWYARMATEYLEHFCGNSLPDCLMMLGPNLVDQQTAYDRAPSELGCFYHGASARFFCYQPPGDILNPPRCVCGVEPFVGDVNPCTPESEDPCCKGGAIFENDCCSVGRTSRLDFSYSIAIDDIAIPPPIGKSYFSGIDNIDKVGTDLETRIVDKIKINDALFLQNTGDEQEQIWVLTVNDPRSSKSYVRRSFIPKHIGILERKDYGGYANFVNRSGGNFHATLDDIFLKHFQELNEYSYAANASSQSEYNEIYRCKTICTVLDAGRNEASISTNTSYMVNSIKDLIYNGYGVVLFSNVGFPNSRDSTGLCYPDRIWYQTYSIIGYDDRQTEYPECVYVLSCPFGEWISGGHPSWGPLPPGCFLVTESHLKCMINFYPGLDFYDCRQKYCNPNLHNCNDPSTIAQFTGCGAGEERKCTQYYCTKQQRAFGMVFALSFYDEGFPKQELPHTDFYPVTAMRKIFQEPHQ